MKKWALTTGQALPRLIDRAGPVSSPKKPKASNSWGRGMTQADQGGTS